MKKKIEQNNPRHKKYSYSDESKMQNFLYKSINKNRFYLLFFLFLFSSLTHLAQCQVKKKVSVSEINFDSAVDDVQWCGNNHSTVLVKTVKGKLYRSSDGGKIWTNITSNLSESFNNKNDNTSGHTPETTAVDLIMVNPINKNIVLVIGAQNSHYISEDAGETFKLINYKNKINFWQFHNKKAHWALVSSWTASCFSTDNTSGECMQTLSLTQDLGANFQLIDIYVVQFNWGDVSSHSEDTIYYTRHRNRNGHQQRFSGWSKDVDFVSTNNFGKDVEVLVKHGNKFLISNGYIFVAKLNDVIKQTVNMMVSTDGGKTFNKANLPKDIHEKSYTILDTSEGAIMLHVNHGSTSEKLNTGNVYISDASGLN